LIEQVRHYQGLCNHAIWLTEGSIEPEAFVYITLSRALGSLARTWQKFLITKVDPPPPNLRGGKFYVFMVSTNCATKLSKL